MGFGSLADPAPPASRVVFVVYGKKLIRSLPPPFIFYQHNAQTGGNRPEIPGSEACGPIIRCAATATKETRHRPTPDQPKEHRPQTELLPQPRHPPQGEPSTNNSKLLEDYNGFPHK